MSSSVDLRSTNFWVKVVGMLQHNWALIDQDAGTARAYFITDTSGIFDEMTFPNSEAAAAALTRNGFKRFAEQSDLQAFLRPPQAPFNRIEHPNGPIYSSGRFWLP